MGVFWMLIEACVCVSVPVSLGEQRQTLADQAVAQQQDILRRHAIVDEQTQDHPPQHGPHPDTHLQTG